MKLSVIVWDGNFRENLHTIRFFGEQTLPHQDYEFLWVDYYGANQAVRQALAQYPNFRLVTLDRPLSENWHLGRCINEGVRQSSGDLLLLPDGDVAVEKDFLASAVEECDQPGHVTYFRRYDELEKDSCDDSTASLSHLEKHCRLLNPLNYAGCLALRRESFEAVNGYEEHPVFSGPGMNAMESYVRLRNSGMAIRWSDRKIYHPWHPNSGSSDNVEQERALLRLARVDHPWINPYSGIDQSWVVNFREKNLCRRADAEELEHILSRKPRIDLSRYAADGGCDG